MSSRPMKLQNHPEVGYHFLTHKGSKKLDHIAASPKGSLLIGNIGTGTKKFAKAKVELVATTDSEIIRKIWKDDYRQFGYTGVDDPNLVVLKVKFVLVTVVDMTVVPQTLQMGSMDAAYAENEIVILTTKDGRSFSSRPMLMRKHSVVGYHFITRKSTKKIAQITKSPGVEILVGKLDSTGSFVRVAAQAEVSDDPYIKTQLWNDSYRQFGYSGPTDPSMIVILLKIVSINETRLPTLKKEINMVPLHNAYAASPIVSLCTHCNSRISSRPMWMRFQEKYGYHFCTRRASHKLEEITSNPTVTVLVGKTDFSSTGYVQVTAKATISDDEATKISLWKDDYKAFGFSGPADPVFVVILLEITDISSSILTPSKIDMTPIDEAYAASPIVNLVTHNEKRLSSRPMWMRKHEELGYHFCTRKGSNKLAQIVAHPEVNILVGKTDFTTKLVTQLRANARADESPEMKRKLWKDDYTQFGFTGADDPNFVPILLTPLGVVTSKIGSSSPDMAPVDSAYGHSQIVKLSTHVGARISSRPMWMQYHPQTGYHFCTRRGSRKLEQIAVNSEVEIFVGDISFKSTGFVSVSHHLFHLLSYLFSSKQLRE